MLAHRRLGHKPRVRRPGGMVVNNNSSPFLRFKVVWFSAKRMTNFLITNNYGLYKNNICAYGEGEIKSVS